MNGLSSLGPQAQDSTLPWLRPPFLEREVLGALPFRFGFSSKAAKSDDLAFKCVQDSNPTFHWFFCGLKRSLDLQFQVSHVAVII